MNCAPCLLPARFLLTNSCCYFFSSTPFPPPAPAPCSFLPPYPDRIVTVSPGYASEIKTWLGGWGMEGLLTSREFVLNGITNGIDTEEWNPATDEHLPVK